MVPVRDPGRQHRRAAGRGFVILEDRAADAPAAPSRPARGRRRELPTSSSGVIRSRLPMPSVTSNLRVGLTPYNITGPRPRRTSEVCSRNPMSGYAAEWQRPETVPELMDQDLAACGETHVSAEAGQSSRWGRGARLTRRVREEPPPGELARVYFDRNATMSGAQRRG